MFVNFIKKGIIYYRDNGLHDTVRGMLRRSVSLLPIIKYCYTRPSTAELSACKANVFRATPTYSILTPLYNTSETFLREMIESVTAQAYPHWQLCLCDASDENHDYVEKIVKEYQKEDPRILYRRLKCNEGISDNTNQCINMATGEYMAILDHDDILHPLALYRVQCAIEQYDADVLYTDETKFIGTLENAYAPNFKPDFSPEELLAHNYVCHFLVFKRVLLEKVGRYDSRFDGSQDHDMVLRLSEVTNHIIHIPEVLYFWRAHSGSVAQSLGVKSYAADAARHAVQSHLERCGIKAEVLQSPPFQTLFHINYQLQEDMPILRVILYGATNARQAQRATQALLHQTVPVALNVIVAAPLHSKLWEISKYIEVTQEKYLLLVHASLVELSDNALLEMLMLAQRADTAAVGLKQIAKDGKLIGCGVTFSKMAHNNRIKWYHGVTSEHHGYEACLRHVRQTSSLENGGILFRTDVLKKLVGLDEKMKEYAIDDFCLRAKQQGYSTYWTPFATAKYTRRVPAEKRDGLTMFQYKWGEYISQGDPNYNDQLWQHSIIR